MQLTFYAAGHKSGLDCNGGTRTIIKSAEALRELGHKVDIVAKWDKYTWDEHPAPVTKIPKDTEALIAVSCNDVKDVWMADVPKKFWWLRALEVWKLPINKIVKRARAVKTIVNAQHLRDWFAESGIDAPLCYAGLDKWHDMGMRYKGGKVNIGCLYHDFHDKGWDTFKKLYQVLGLKNYNYYGFGAKLHRANWVKKYYANPSKEKLTRLYNTCDIWLCDTKNEGFFNVGSEAGLCGCLLYTNRLPHNGTSDYATEDTAMTFDSFEELYAKIKNPDWGKISKCQERLCEIGSREKNMERFVEILNA